MKAIQQLTEQLKAERSPASQLGEFILSHSNNIHYVVDVLECFLEAARKDQERLKNFTNMVLKSLKNND